MSTLTQSQMHDAHLQWQCEHDAWMADVGRWQDESRSALAELADVASLWNAHREALRGHAEAIRGHGESLQGHEIALAEMEQGGLAERRDEVIARHLAQLRGHCEQRLLHETLEQRHRDALAQLHRLAKALRSGARVPASA